MNHSKLSPQQISDYHRDGYIVVKKFCSSEEAKRLYASAIEDDVLKKNALDLNDQSGKKTKLALWFTPGNDVFGYLTRSEKIDLFCGGSARQRCTRMPLSF